MRHASVTSAVARVRPDRAGQQRLGLPPSAVGRAEWLTERFPRTCGCLPQLGRRWPQSRAASARHLCQPRQRAGQRRNPWRPGSVPDLVGLVRQLGGAAGGPWRRPPGGARLGPVRAPSTTALMPTAHISVARDCSSVPATRPRACSMASEASLNAALDHGQLGLEQMERPPELDVGQRRRAGSDLFEQRTGAVELPAQQGQGDVQHQRASRRSCPTAFRRSRGPWPRLRPTGPAGRGPRRC